MATKKTSPTTTYHCGTGHCPGTLGEQHHPLDCPSELVRDVAYAQLDAGACGGAGYRGLRGLHRAAALRERAERIVASKVATAREDGASWAQIAGELGITKQAAQQRYGKDR